MSLTNKDLHRLSLEKRLCESSHLFFSRYFFKHRNNCKFILNPHHKIITDTLDRVFSGEITRLIINIPPGYTKTELAVINFIARGLALNRKSKFIHVSSSDRLALVNSVVTRDLVLSEEYQRFWPMSLKSDRNAKSDWFNADGGGLLALGSKGSITGFRAGLMEKSGFSGALIIDDPLQASDASSAVITDVINFNFNFALRNRTALETTPIILIMQRLCDNDLSGFCLRGGTPDTWHHLLIPADVPLPEDKPAYSSEYTHGLALDYSLPAGPLWPFKHSRAELEAIKVADSNYYTTQLLQEPFQRGGAIFQETSWRYYDNLPVLEGLYIFVDTASKTGEHNDFTVFQCWGKAGNKIYLIDQDRGKWESSLIKDRFMLFYLKHYGTGVQTYGRIRGVYIEDASSGIGMIQDLERTENIPLYPIKRQGKKDKVARARDVVGYIDSGHVFLPRKTNWLLEYILEFNRFTATNKHKHDDQIDPTVDAIDVLLRPTQRVVGGW